jgi:two-component system chemotaxis response regulator CheB
MVEKVRVLVVDDSAFFRKRIREELGGSGDIEIVGEAANGREAVEMAGRLKPDLITMDVAMPEMDGIAAVREIMRAHPTRIIMISALTSEGARATLEALDAGAVDFMAKQQGLGADKASALHTRIIDITRSRPVSGPDAVHRVADARIERKVASNQHALRPGLILIGASTGGPVAIQRVLATLPANYPYPLLVAVHMPAEFTATFAERLDHLCSLKVRLATDGEELRAGTALIAPGGQQTLVESHQGRKRVRIRPGGEQIYKPSVDLTFGSAARALDGDSLAVVLTGMGTDGTDGARMLKDRGGSVWSQDEQSSVVYGMPFSVAKAGLSDRVLALDDIGEALQGLA